MASFFVTRKVIVGLKCEYLHWKLAPFCELRTEGWGHFSQHFPCLYSLNSSTSPSPDSKIQLL